MGRWQIRNWYKGGLLDPDAREALVCKGLDAGSIRWGEDQRKEKKKGLFLVWIPEFECGDLSVYC